MVETTRQDRWRVIGRCVHGAAHRRQGMPNQDAIEWHSNGRDGYLPPAILAIADGHGNAKSFRSDVGSDIAVKIAIQALKRFLDGEWRGGGLSVIKRAAEERLPGEIVRMWRDAVAQHLNNAPVTDDELLGLEAKEGVGARDAVQRDPHIAYGATLLLAIAASEFILYLQLGDGDTLAVATDGTVCRPMPPDSRLFANETTSLAGSNAWADFRVVFQPASESMPALILLSTDGYANSFRDEASFLKVGPDLLDLIRANGLDRIVLSLGDWLNEASEAGSGDDVTLGIICRITAFEASNAAGVRPVPAPSSNVPESTRNDSPPAVCDNHPDPIVEPEKAPRHA